MDCPVKTFDQVSVSRIQDFKRDYWQYMRTTYPDIGRSIAESGDLSDQAIQGLRAATQEFLASGNYREEAQ